MFFKKAKVPNLTDLLSNSLNKLFEAFEKAIFKTQSLDSEQKVELATYLLFFYIHAMLVRNVPRDIILSFPTNVAVLPMLTSGEKIALAKKYQERMEEYSKTLTEVEDNNSVLNVAVLFLSNFFKLTKEEIGAQKIPQLMATELLSANGLTSATDIVDLCTKHNHLR